MSRKWKDPPAIHRINLQDGCRDRLHNFYIIEDGVHGVATWLKETGIYLHARDKFVYPRFLEIIWDWELSGLFILEIFTPWWQAPLLLCWTWRISSSPPPPGRSSGFLTIIIYLWQLHRGQDGVTNGLVIVHIGLAGEISEQIVLIRSSIIYYNCIVTFQ